MKFAFHTLIYILISSVGIGAKTLYQGDGLNGHLKYIGFYNVAGYEPPAHYDWYEDVKHFSNISQAYDDEFLGFLQNTEWSNTLLQRIASSSNDQVMWILDIQKVFYDYDGSTGLWVVKSDAQIDENIEILKSRLTEDILNNIIAFQISDEPYGYSITATDLERIIHKVNTHFPDQKTFITFYAGSIEALDRGEDLVRVDGGLAPNAEIRIPVNLDWVGIGDGYHLATGGFFNAFLPSLPPLRRQTDKPIFFAFQSSDNNYFGSNGAKPDYTHRQVVEELKEGFDLYLNEALGDPQVMGLLGFNVWGIPGNYRGLEHYMDVPSYISKFVQMQADLTHSILLEAENRSGDGGGLNIVPDEKISGLNSGDWYFHNNINFKDDYPKLVIRYSSNGPGGTLTIREDSNSGRQIASVALASTGSWDAYEYVEVNINSPQGLNDIYVRASGIGTNDLLDIDWIKFTRNYETIQQPIEPDRPPYQIRIEAESAGEKVGCDVFDGFKVGNIEHGDWIRLDNVNFATGVNTMNVRFSSGGQGGYLELYTGGPNGNYLGHVELPRNGSWTLFENRSAPIRLLEGTETVFARFTGSAGFLFDVDWIEFSYQSDAGPVLPPPPPPPLPAITIKVEPENADHFEHCQSVDSVKVGYIDHGDWIEFRDLDLKTGVNEIVVNYASGGVGGSMEVFINDIYESRTGFVNLDNTGGWNNFRKAQNSMQFLSGIHTLYVKFSGDIGFLFDIESIEFRYNADVSAPSGSPKVPGLRSYGFTLQAEHATEFRGCEVVDNEKVGYIHNRDWIRFESANFDTGTRNVEINIASAGNGGQIELRANSPTGPTLGVIEIPNTGGWNNFRNIRGTTTHITNTKDLYLVFRGDRNGFLFDIDRIRFSN